MRSNREINEYLFYEFGLDLDADSGRISEDWPFSLESVGVFHSPYGEREVRRFDAEGTTYYLIAGTYVGIIEEPASGRALIVGTGIPARIAPAPGLPP